MNRGEHKRRTGQGDLVRELRPRFMNGFLVALSDDPTFTCLSTSPRPDGARTAKAAYLDELSDIGVFFP